jgi:hypothetical protein
VDIDPHKLPNDPAALRQMVMSLLEEVESQESSLRQLQHWVEQLLRARYGPRRERVNENQFFLFAVALVSAGREAPPSPQPRRARRKLPRGRARRRDMAGACCRNLCSGNEWSMILEKANGSAQSARKR